jgi:hypothetical protein
VACLDERILRKVNEEKERRDIGRVHDAFAGPPITLISVKPNSSLQSLFHPIDGRLVGITMLQL